jgi:general stress protein YciG
LIEVDRSNGRINSISHDRVQVHERGRNGGTQVPNSLECIVQGPNDSRFQAENGTSKRVTPTQSVCSKRSIENHIPCKRCQCANKEEHIDDQDPSNGTRFLVRSTSGFSLPLDFLETAAESAALTQATKEREDKCDEKNTNENSSALIK